MPLKSETPTQTIATRSPSRTGLIRVLVVDDAVFMRSMIKQAVEKQPDMEIIGSAQNGAEAIKKIKDLGPDVVTLDIEMPGVSGLEVLDEILPSPNLRIVMVSTLTQNGAQATFEALKKGAFDYVPKPLNTSGYTIQDYHADIVDKIRGAAESLKRGLLTSTNPAGNLGVRSVSAAPLTDKVVVIGISCGGPMTLLEFLPAFPEDFPPIAVVLHMPSSFTGRFAERLDSVCKMRVKHAETNDNLERGQILLAPGGLHMKLNRMGGRLLVALDDGPKVSGFKPSVDVLFQSAADAWGEKVIGVVMTGMGNDGSDGIRALKAKGAATLAQDAETSVVYGMPKEAFRTGCVDQVVSLQDLPGAISKWL